MPKTLFVSLQHRRSPLYEEGIKLLAKDYPVIVVNTGLPNGFGDFGVQDKNVTYINLHEHLNYDQGVVRLKEILKDRKWDILHFIDNDCFIHSTDYIRLTLQDFEKSEFGFCSYVENGFNNQNKYLYPNTMGEVTDQSFMGTYPYMNPSWENAMMMFKREAWEKVSDWSDMQFWIPELWGKGVKFGIKRVEPRLKYSHSGPGFIHIGKLMKYYYLLEGDLPLESEPEIDQSRIGYFLYQALFLDVEYSSEIDRRLAYWAEMCGGPERCLKAWFELVKNHYELPVN